MLPVPGLGTEREASSFLLLHFVVAVVVVVELPDDGFEMCEEGFAK